MRFLDIDRLPLQTATFAVGRALDNKPIRIAGCVMTCFLVAMWFFVFAMMIRALILKQILWPQKQEDRDEGGWVTQAEKSQQSLVQKRSF